MVIQNPPDPLAFVKSFIEYSKITKNLDKKQVRFFEWQLEKSIEVSTAMVDSYLLFDGAIQRLLDQRFYEPIPKQCFMNSYEVSMITGLDYIEGMCSGLIPFNHAWNAVPGKEIHIDTTLNPSEFAYAQICRIPANRLEKLTTKRKFYGDLKSVVFLEELKDELDS